MTVSSLYPDISNRKIKTNGIELNIAEQGSGPLILLIHGFPESWYSWRHQFAPLSAAGYKVVAPDMRGYGDSDKPFDVSAYNQFEIVNDIRGLVKSLDYGSAIVIGHDWGAPSAWNCALWHPGEFSAVGALSVPFIARSESPPLEKMRKLFAGKFFYQLYFQEPGVAEAEFETDIETNLKKFFHTSSGGGDFGQLHTKPADSDLLSDICEPKKLGAWLSVSDLHFYTKEFERNGFRGPLNYYRNQNLTWEKSENQPLKVLQPALFLAGALDGVINMARPALDSMPEFVPDLRVNQLIPGIGHWTQQEAPDAVNEVLLDWLDNL